MSINIYPSIIHDGDFAPDSFGADVDDVCNEIHEATQGFGTNEKRLLKALGNCNAETRCKVPARYLQIYGKNLLDVVQSECGNRVLGTALQYLSVDPVQAECEMIEDACKGFGTNEIFLFSIICGRSNSEIALLKKKYHDVKDRDLERHLCRETSGNVETLIKDLLDGAEEEYNPDYHTEEKAEEDADHLRSMGEGRWGTNEKGLLKILCTAPPRYVRSLNSKYEEKNGHDLVKAIKGELNGVLEKATLFLLEMKLNPPEQVARMIHDAVAGFGTNELLLTTYLIRYQTIMNDVNEAYERLYNKSIKSVVKSETSGEFEDLLVEISEA